MKRNIVAKSTHKRMVQDERFGYSWEERWGHAPEKWTVEGLTFTINVGDYDCSSSTITAWRKALTGTKWEHALDDATYTGNMKDVFLASGLFEWKPMSFIASPGDLYLNEENHVAMCQQQVPDELSEFSWGDNGAYGNKRGDQSGFESRVNPFYDYPWDGILHYNGKADTVASTTSGTYKVVASPFIHVRDKASTVKGVIKAQVKTGAKLSLTNVKTNSAGNTWGKIASGAHKGRYVCVKFKGYTLLKKA